MTEGLSKSTMKQVCTLVTDGTHDTPRVLSDGIPLVKAKEIVGGIIDYESATKISYDDHLKVISRSKPEYGDTLFAHIGASLGESAYIKNRKEFSIKNVALFKPNRDIINERYLYYYIIGPKFQEEIKNSRTGSAQPFVGLDTLRNFKIYYHKKLTTQRKIASILSAYDDLIENNTRRIKILEEMAHTIYKEWFVNFRFPGHEKVKFVDSRLGKIPEGWEAVPLRECVESYIGGGWGKEKKIEGFCESAYVIRGTDMPLLRNGDISNTVLRYHKHSNLKSRKLIEDDIIIEVSGGSTDQPVGRSIILGKGLINQWDDDVMCASFCKLMRVNAKIVSPFQIYLHLNEIYDNGNIMKYQVQSTGIKNFKFEVFLDNEFIVLPSKNIMSEFHSIINSKYEKIFLLGRLNQNLRKTRDLLLPKLMSGEVEANNKKILRDK